MSEEFKILRIHHAIIVPKNWARSMAFWRDALGLPVQDDWSSDSYHIASLKIGESTMVLAEPDKDRDAEAGVHLAQGWPYLYLEVKGIDAFIQAVREKGGEVLRAPTSMPWGAKIATLKDPDGIPIMAIEIEVPQILA